MKENIKAVGFAPTAFALLDLMLHTARTHFIFAEELFKEVDDFEEKAAYATFMAVAGARFVLRLVGGSGCVRCRLFKGITTTIITLIVAVVINV